MGRRDAVQVTLEVIRRMRELEPRLLVTWEPGWETRGNGLSANFDFATVHHTASPTSLARPFPTQTLLRDGRADLRGPLCNEAGPACTVEAPRIHVMAAHPANHAGASRASGPVPALAQFNSRSRGLEIDYAGTVPMLAGQLYVAHLWTRANADVLAGGNVEHVRAHQETSVTGKYDPGFAPGKTYNMAAFRATAANLQEELVLTDLDIQRIRHAVAEAPIGGVPGNFPRIKTADGKQTNDVMLWNILGPLVAATEKSRAELTQKLPDRVGSGRRETEDTVLGYAIEAHAAAVAALDGIKALWEKVDALSAPDLSTIKVEAQEIDYNKIITGVADELARRAAE